MPRLFATREDEWRALLTGTHPRVRSGRVVFGLLPYGPRCRQCKVPFRGPGGFLLRHIGSAFRPWEKNPNLCRRCLGHLSRQEVSGAEVDATFLFADVRRSSDLARRVGTMEFTRLMQRFYATASLVFLDHDALLDKFVGDEAVGFFLPFMAGREHPRKAVETARDLFEAVGYGSVEGPWVPLGAGAHTGTAFVGLVSKGSGYEFTALGDTINVAAHLAAQAGPGEILVTEEVAASLGSEGLERRSLSLKGHPVDAVVVPFLSSRPRGSAAGPNTGPPP
jgi:adenylate cyclase